MVNVLLSSTTVFPRLFGMMADNFFSRLIKNAISDSTVGKHDAKNPGHQNIFMSSSDGSKLAANRTSIGIVPHSSPLEIR